jgi:hypothetical protein
MNSRTTLLDQRNKRPFLRTANPPERPYFNSSTQFLCTKTIKLINEEGVRLQRIGSFHIFFVFAFFGIADQCGPRPPVFKISHFYLYAFGRIFGRLSVRRKVSAHTGQHKYRYSFITRVGFKPTILIVHTSERVATENGLSISVTVNHSQSFTVLHSRSVTSAAEKASLKFTEILGFRTLSIVLWTKSKNPIFLCVIHHRLNPIVSTRP